MSIESRPFGLWDSPLSARSLAEDKRLDAVRYDGHGGLVWLEGRSGQGVLVHLDRSGNAPRDLTSDLSVRGEVGYGGGDFALHGDHVYFAVHKTGRLFRQAISGGRARAITPPFGQAASPAISPDGRFVLYVHHDDGEDRLAIVDAEGKQWPQIAASGHDFYMQPRWSPDGKSIAYIAWDHPNMPWDGTTLYRAPVSFVDGQLPCIGDSRAVAGGKDIAIFQPEFTPDGTLLYISDETGWQRLVLHDLANGERRYLTEPGMEAGLPGWLQDMRTYAVGHDGKYVMVALGKNAVQSIVRIDLASGSSETIAAVADYTEVNQLVSASDAGRFAFVGSGTKQPARVIECDLTKTSPAARVVARASTEILPASALSSCESISWPSTNGETSHGLFFAPRSNRFTATGAPPLIVLVHGGPTSHVRAGWRADGQFFATRGYAVLYVNYRGSTGYGRDYMLKLRGNWGICDVEDSLSGAAYLAKAGRVDGERMVIMGGSAGGFTVLQTMVEHPEAFVAGVCLYGVSDQFQLNATSHKFEIRYNDTLIGPLPEAAELFRQRSPALHAERICRPLAVFQGSEDKVVPPDQSEVIVSALRETGTPHVYHLYQGEGHGWRKRETIEHFYQAVEAFLQRYVIYR